MPGFRVVVHGVLAPKRAAGATFSRGFYAAQSVEAPSQASAELRALAELQADARVLEIMASWRSGPPDLTVDFVVPLTAAELAAETPLGFIFYDESGELAEPPE